MHVCDLRTRICLQKKKPAVVTGHAVVSIRTHVLFYIYELFVIGFFFFFFVIVCVFNLNSVKTNIFIVFCIPNNKLFELKRNVEQTIVIYFLSSIYIKNVRTMNENIILPLREFKNNISRAFI